MIHSHPFQPHRCSNGFAQASAAAPKACEFRFGSSWLLEKWHFVPSAVVRMLTDKLLPVFRFRWKMSTRNGSDQQQQQRARVVAVIALRVH